MVLRLYVAYSEVYRRNYVRIQGAGSRNPCYAIRFYEDGTFATIGGVSDSYGIEMNSYSNGINIR